MGEERFNLPPGFRFQPTDEELVVHFLYRKAALLPCHPDIIPDVDLCRYDPWELNGKALTSGDNKLYLFSHITTQDDEERISPNGYWKHLGVDDPIISSDQTTTVGFKKFLAFYIGEAPVGVKTNWVMNEYHLFDSHATSTSSRSSSRTRRSSGKPKKASNDQWVLCRVHESNCGDDGLELSCLDEVFLSMDDMDEISFPNSRT